MDKKTKLEQARILQRHKWFLTKNKEQFFPDPNELNKFIDQGVCFGQKIKYIGHNCEGLKPQKLFGLQHQTGVSTSYKDNNC